MLPRTQSTFYSSADTANANSLEHLAASRSVASSDVGLRYVCVSSLKECIVHRRDSL